jgi:hypothetical protein
MVSAGCAASQHVSYGIIHIVATVSLLLQVLHAVKAHRKLKQAGIGQRLVHEVLCIELEKDGSDTWRLEPVIEVLKQGGVSNTGCHSATSQSLSVACCRIISMQAAASYSVASPCLCHTV